MSIRNVPAPWWCSVVVKIANLLTGQFIRNAASDGPVLYCVIGFSYIL